MMLNKSISMGISSYKKDYIVFLRFFCIIGLIIHHAALALPTSFSSRMEDYLAVCNIIGRMTRFMVPVFLMITGCLLLDRNKKISLTYALNKYGKRVLFVICVVGFVFAILQNSYLDGRFSLEVVFKSLLDLYQGKTWKHFWYLYMLYGVYCILPLLKAYVNIANKKEITYFTMLMFVFVSFFPCLSEISSISCGIVFPIMSEYVLYMFLGFLLSSRRVFDLFRRRILFLLLIFMLVYSIVWIGSYLQYYHSFYFFENLFSYSSPLTVIMSVLVYLIPKIYIEAKNIQIKNIIICEISNLSFGIYIFHMLWIHLFYKFLKFNPLENYNYILFGVFCVIVLFLSALTTVLCKKIPILGKYL